MTEYQDNNENQNNGKLEYPYAKWMLDEIKGQYIVENEREGKIATKASAFITVVVAIITLYIPMIPFEKVLKFWDVETTTYVKVLVVIAIIFLCVGLGFFMFAFGVLIKAYGVKGYNRVRVDDLAKISAINENNCDWNESQIAQGLVAHYHEILRGNLDREGNMKINSKSADNVKVGIKCTVIGFVLLSIATIMLRIIL